MNITYVLADLLDKLAFSSSKIPYWVEIQTENPTCIYYFGHFDSLLAARLMHKGYVEDLTKENAKVVKVELKRCQPERLTIVEPVVAK